MAAGEGRFGRALKLPDGGQLFIKVATQDSGGAFFLTERPSGQKGGPPMHAVGARAALVKYFLYRRMKFANLDFHRPSRSFSSHAIAASPPG